MPALTEAAIRELASIKGEAAPVTSCYLDVDGRRFVRRQDLEHEVDTLLRDARHRFDGDESVAALTSSGSSALVRRGIDRSQVRGLAIFACSAEGLWEVIELPGPGPQPRRREPRARGGPARGRAPRARADRRADGRPPAGPHVRLRDGEAGRAVRAVRRHRPRDRQGRARPGRRPGQSQAARTQAHLRNAASVAFDVWQERPLRAPGRRHARLPGRRPRGQPPPLPAQPPVGPPERAGGCRPRRRAGRRPGHRGRGRAPARGRARRAAAVGASAPAGSAWPACAAGGRRARPATGSRRCWSRRATSSRAGGAPAATRSP